MADRNKIKSVLASYLKGEITSIDEAVDQVIGYAHQWTWTLGSVTPPVEIGREREYVVAVKRKHNGGTYSFAATYCNAVPLRYEWGCPNGGEKARCDKCTNDGCPTTGWFTLTGDANESYQYQNTLDDGDELVAWAELPRWEPGRREVAR